MSDSYAEHPASIGKLTDTTKASDASGSIVTSYAESTLGFRFFRAGPDESAHKTILQQHWWVVERKGNEVTASYGEWRDVPLVIGDQKP